MTRCPFAIAAVFVVGMRAIAVEAADCSVVVGEIASMQGSVAIGDAPGREWRPARANEPLCEGAIIQVGERSRALLTLVDRSKYRLDQNTTLQISQVRRDRRSLLQLLQGIVYFFSRESRTLQIDTPFINAAVEGTEFVLAVADGETRLSVFEGRVLAGNDHGQLPVASGESVVAREGEAPQSVVVVHPRNQVQWALHYPFILLPLADPSGQAAQTVAEPLGSAVALAARGELAAAFARFETIDQADRDAGFYLYRAGALLTVGRVAEARADIDAALAIDPRLGPAYGLRAVIAVATNDPMVGLQAGQRAVALSPGSAAAAIALSYAQQASFQIADALRTMQRAIAEDPDNALAWARVSELRLMLGDRRHALQAAGRALALAPDLPRAQAVRGFAALAAIDIAEAQRTFAQAIAIDSADPQPRFGLGLALIRSGRLQDGRMQIETAIALDPDNALLRSYLGKAFFEERRNALAGEQFAMAQSLDSNDPTPWLYDAIRKQSENQPVAALHDLQTSMALNDGRAVYRSRELLDADRAARGASLARIYDDLGFLQLGVDAATKSLTIDPANASAHRFLADIYVAQPRRESARVSETLQAQLLQDINIDPVQPSRSQTNLNIASRGGPAQPGFSEYTPLFERNQVQAIVSSEIGNKYTSGDEVVVSGIYDKFSLSAGQYYYETDGFRKNFDLGHQVYNLYGQAAVTPELNIQTELMRRVSEEGNRSLTFQDALSIPGRRQVNQDIARLGVRYTPAPQSNLLLSLVTSDFDERRPPTIGKVEQDGTQLETQYLFRHDRLAVIAGAGAYHVDQSGHVELPYAAVSLDDNLRRANGYLYANLHWPADLLWTAGVSYDDYDDNKTKLENKKNLVNGKFGVRWSVSDDLSLRLAALQTSKPALVASRTIEPTQIAGFNQFYDDPTGTVSTDYGAGMDLRISETLSLGAEFVRRDLDAPYVDVDAGRIRFADAKEDRSSAYAYWAPLEQLAFTSGIQLDRFDADGGATDLPSQVQTLALPLSVRYFSPAGLFAVLAGTSVFQDVNRPDASALFAEGSDSFFVLDATIGYRFPGRRGMVSLQAQNLLNSGFHYQDDRFRTFEQQSSVGAFLPERAIVGRLTLNF